MTDTVVSPTRGRPTSTGSVADFVAGIATAPLTALTRDLATRHILDTVASVVACRDLEPSTVARRYALTNSPGGEAPILGTTESASLVDAVFASAMAGHGAEVNDFMPSVFVQPGPAVVATALCMAHHRSLSGRSVVHAVVAGYELAARVPRGLGGDNLRRAGLASHGVAPTFAAAAAAASLAELDSVSIGHVLAACAQQASGSWQWMLDVEHIEKSFVFAGMGARNGVQSVLLVEAGFAGVRDCLDVPGGWGASNAFRGGDEDPDAFRSGLDQPAAMHDTAYKRYPVGGPTQPAVEALLDLVSEVDRADVAHVRIAMPGRADAFRDAAMPALNLRYLTALILQDGHLDFESAQSLSRMRGDEALASKMLQVEVVHDPAQETGVGRSRAESANVTLTMSDGSLVERHVAHVRGFPTHPMDREDVESKAMALMRPTLGSERSSAVIEFCRTLEDHRSVGQLIDLIAT